MVINSMLIVGFWKPRNLEGGRGGSIDRYTLMIGGVVDDIPFKSQFHNDERPLALSYVRL